MATLIATSNVPATVIRIVPEIAPYVTVTPTNLGALRKGQQVSITLKFAAPITALPLAASGTAQLRANDSTSATVAQPLPLSVRIVLPTFSDPTQPIQFSYADFGRPATINMLTQQDATMARVSLETTPGTVVSEYAISLFPNPTMQPLFSWFAQNIDPSGVLLSSQAFHAELLPNGAQALVLRGPVPDSHTEQNGPVAEVYANSLGGATILSAFRSQVNDLQELGITDEALRALFKAILGTVVTP